ncbi:hypothetical protein NLJ89_g8261 [Agrocybe chaxingu]|uniref:Uncharacterized protein n=1 Tax=Agrocybe chaxingu TaxID=84603 RepID=A0A9W8MQY4_9AGAR|nr:hypothetical protein NLJ89_g8261 [Agrocybe chaxingu]
MNRDDSMPLPNFSREDRLLMMQPWMDKLMIVHPGESRERLAAFYGAQHGSLAAAAAAFTHVYKYFGTLKSDDPQPVSPPWGPTPSIGRQPYANEGGVVLLPLETTNYGLRFWPGDIGQHKICSLGFYDRRTNEPINTPARYTICADDFPEEHGSNILKSLEECYQVDLTRIRPGSQTYLVHQGMRISVYVDNERIASGIEVPKYSQRPHQ